MIRAEHGAQGGDSLARRLHEIYQQLATLPSLEPSPQVNGLFTELVELSIRPADPESGRLLADPVVAAIRGNLWRICARGEYELEREWALRILDACKPEDALLEFPYHENYLRLTRLELLALQAVHGAPVRSIAFAGCGPLPLTAILAATLHGAAVTAIDVDAAACRLASQVAQRLRLERFTVLHGDVRTVDLGSHSVVALAALVGRTAREKRDVLQHLARTMSPQGLLLVRSAHRLRSLLYPPLEAEQIDPFEPVVELRPHDEIINSVIIGRSRRCTRSAAA